MKIEARFETRDGAVGPDPWDTSWGATLPMDHIICRDEKGMPHYVREFMWPWTAYHPHQKYSVLHFLYWKRSREVVKVIPADITPEREVRIREIQRLMCSQIYSCVGKENSFGTLKEKLKSLYLVARYAESKKCTVQKVLEQQTLLDDFIRTIPGAFAHYWIGWLNFLGTFGPGHLFGFRIATSRHWQELRQCARNWSKKNQQHAPLPTRIYAGLINNLRNELDEIEEHADLLLRALGEAIELHRAANSENLDNAEVFGGELLNRHGLSAWFKQRGYDLSLKGFTRAATEVFAVCKLQIHVFSGMRETEALNLPFHCMVTEKSAHGRKHCLIAGTTTKLEGSRRRRTKWVTTEQEGFRAIRLAQRVASVIYECLGVTPSNVEQFKDDFPLFPSPCYLPWTSWINRIRKDRIVPAQSLPSKVSSSLCPVIEDADIEELEEIDPFRSWREEPQFFVGNHWPLTPHQLRRSLALYANASGLVRISSLRRQLQHLAQEMAFYYARGSTFCRNFIADDPTGFKKHMAPEWQDGNEEAQILAFTMDVLNSKEPLFGGAGNFFQRQRERNDIMSNEEIKKQFKFGLLNYNESPLGGCTKPGICSTRKGLLLVDVACATENCKYLVGKHSKIIQVIRLKRASIEHMNPNSISYAMEKEELDSLEKVELSWRPQSDPSIPVVDSGDEHGRHS